MRYIRAEAIVVVYNMPERHCHATLHVTVRGVLRSDREGVSSASFYEIYATKKTMSEGGREEGVCPLNPAEQVTACR